MNGIPILLAYKTDKNGFEKNVVKNYVKKTML